MMHSNATGQIIAGTASLQGDCLRSEIPLTALPIVTSFAASKPVAVR